MFGTDINSTSLAALKTLFEVERRVDKWLRDNWTSGTAEVPLTPAMISTEVETLIEARYVTGTAAWSTAVVNGPKDTFTLTPPA